MFDDRKRDFEPSVRCHSEFAPSATPEPPCHQSCQHDDRHSPTIFLRLPVSLILSNVRTSICRDRSLVKLRMLPTSSSVSPPRSATPREQPLGPMSSGSLCSPPSILIVPALLTTR